jgi:outer membrane receptor for ferric coprogen and ferric-rhodotorulic acid
LTLTSSFSFGTPIQAPAFPSGEIAPAGRTNSGSNFHEEEAIMKTRQQKFRSWDEHRAIYALLATAGIISSTQAQEQTQAVMLEPVVVTDTRMRYTSEAVSVASKESVKPREIPQSVSVITKERIEDQGLVTVEDALNQVTGVTVLPNDTQQGVYLSRGFHMNVTNDGVPAYNALSGVQQLDLAIYERVEVLRGPAGLFQGTGDPGGTVNLVR